MDIDNDDLGPGGGGAENITDQLSMFYSEIEGTPEPDTLEPEEDEEAGEEDSLPDDASSTSQCSAPNSPPPASPSVSQPKKRKKVKIKTFSVFHRLLLDPCEKVCRGKKYLN